MAGASGRARGSSRGRLSVDRIVDVAISQLRERGYDAVTMRSIARELGTGQASLYAHVAHRNELDGLVMGRISTMLEVPDPDPERWRDQIKEMGLSMLRLYREHPGTARCSMGNIPSSIDALVPVERMFAIMRAGGVPDHVASWFGDQFALYVSAYAMEEDIWRARARAEDRSVDEVWEDIPSIFEGLPPEQFPLLTSMGPTLVEGDPDERFSFGLDLLVAGMAALAG